VNDSLSQATVGPDDRGLDHALRPAHFGEFVGQEAVIGNLSIYIRAARLRQEPLDHILLSGLPGLGKTTLAEIIAREMGSTLHATSGPVLERPGDLAGLVTNLKRGDILFIDEIHRLPPQVEEYLYSAMEDFCIDIMLDQGPRARSVRLDIEPFTLVGATTRDGLLSPPFRARFGVLERLEPYPVEHLVTIVKRSAALLRIGIDTSGAGALAQHARGTPRIVNRYVRRLRDLAQVEDKDLIDEPLAKRGLAMLGVDDTGLLKVDRAILDAVALAGGQPVGLRTIGITVGEDDRTVEDVYEPHLIRCGLLLKTARGRLLTPRGYEILNRQPPASSEQARLFPEE
jgi:holliday junction DNA helicase RuvB